MTDAQMTDTKADDAVSEPPPPPAAKGDSPGSPKKSRALGRAARVALGLVVGLGIAELVFRARDDGAFPHLNVYLADDALGVRLRPGATEQIRFSNNPVSKVRINADGFRGDAWPAPSADEVVVVGDSQVFGLGVEEGETFSRSLETALGGKRLVRNLGVPTYGPREYNAVLDESLTKRPAKLVIYTVNLANDLFEANRPNKDRHAVWDGWAVRKETAPSSVTAFPGRSLLYTDSHAFYALRRYMYDRGPKIDEGGFASEGTWRDIGTAGTEASRERIAAEQETARLAQLHDSELRYATDSVSAVDQHLTSKVIYGDYPSMKEGAGFDYDSDALTKAAQLRAARLSPGDIVTTSYGEQGRDVRVNAEQIRRGAALRLAVEKEARKKAEDQHDKELLGLFQRRDDLEKKMAALQAEPAPKVEALSPLTPALKEAKAICDKHGARLFVVALPIDVQVSPAEWAKYHTAPIDMEASKVLVDDIVVAARSVGADGLDATAALAAAEPGAFLDGDIHMTAKGHKALGEAIAKELSSVRFDPRLQVPRSGIPIGRTAMPAPGDWVANTEIAVRESDPAGCETKKLREWVGIFCRGKGGAKSVTVRKGAEVVAGAMPGGATLIAPLYKGQHIEATFGFDGTTRDFTVDVPNEHDTASIEFDKAKPGGAAPVAAGAEVGAMCTCISAKTPGETCVKGNVVPDADCSRTYASDCTKLLACSSGDPAAVPTCAAGAVNIGAPGRCGRLCSDAVPCAAGTCTAFQGGRVCM